MEHILKAIEEFKEDPTIRSIDASSQTDGTPYVKIERFNDISPISKLSAVAHALNGCSSMENSGEENCIRIRLAKVAADLAEQI